MWKRAFADTIFQFGYRNLHNLWRFIVPTVLAILIIRYLGGQGQMNEELRWIIASVIAVVIVFGITFLFNLIRAPVFIKFEKEREPYLTIEGTSVCNYGDKLGHSWRLKVKNNGIDLAEDCRGQLVALKDEIPQSDWSLEGWPVKKYLSWGGDKECISIPALQTIELEIANYGGRGEYLHLAYAEGEIFRQQHAVKVLQGGIILLISISSKGKLPIYAVCIFHESDSSHNNLELKEVTTKCPDITLYQRLNSHKEGY